MGNMFKCVLASGTGNGIPLIVSCTSAFAGLTITCTDGTTTLTDTCPSSSPYEVTFNLPNTGTWTVSAIISGELISNEIIVSDLELDLSQTKINVDFYSAANDTVSYTDINGNLRTITTDSDGHASATIEVYYNSSSSITFTSSVAYNPTNLSNFYSKTVSINKNTTKISLMPTKAWYWYGNKCAHIWNETLTSRTSGSGATVTFNTNYINSVHSGTTNGTGVVERSNTTISAGTYTKIKTVYTATSGSSDGSTSGRFPTQTRKASDLSKLDGTNVASVVSSKTLQTVNLSNQAFIIYLAYVWGLTNNVSLQVYACYLE